MSTRNASESATPLRRQRRGRAVVALLAMLAGLVVLAQPAAATSGCGSDPDGSMVVFLDRTGNEQAEAELEMRSGVLFLNGDRCGVPGGPDGPSVAIIDIGAAKVDRLQINLAAGAWRVGGQSVFVNLFLDDTPAGDQDEVTIRGTKGVDQVMTFGDFIQVSRDRDYSPGDARRLFMFTFLSTQGSGGVKYYFELRGGDDAFQMIRDLDGNHFDGWLSVKGGAGEDEFVGGPGRQRFRGGAGADNIDGRDGNDYIKGNSGRDQLQGGSGNDTIIGGTAGDLIIGNSGNDKLRGNSGADEILGGSGADEIDGGKGRDTLGGGSGPDTFDASDGMADQVDGNKGADVCDCDRGLDERRSVRLL